MADDESTSFDPVADFYDESAAHIYADSVVTPVVDLLAELAGSGRALELGIGTGRIALPLAVRGVPVSGIDASQRMVEKMREKPGGNDILVFIGTSRPLPSKASSRSPTRFSTQSGTCAPRKSRLPASRTLPDTSSPADIS